jgi:hypothetical protein
MSELFLTQPKLTLPSNYIKGFVQEPQKPEKFFFDLICFQLNVSKSKIDRLGCVCQTKNPMQRRVAVV